jgi:S-(hydroxymethyl)mycothiol dehydrogenase
MDRGAVVRNLGRLELCELELDDPGPGEVVVRLEATGVCHTDLHVMETGFNHPLPVLLGHEGAGVVEVAGDGVELRVGDRVVLGWRSPCGKCRWCARGDERRCRTPPRAARRLRAGDDKLSQTLQLGTFATRTVVHGSAAIPIPDGLPPEQACLLGCAVVTGVSSVLETARVWEGARVGVIGCGAVGLSVVQGASIAGAEEIHALDLDERKLDAARRFGATHTGPAEQLDFVFDVVGNPQTVAQGLEMLGHAGTLVYIGLPQPEARAELHLNPFFDKRTRILVSHGGDHWPAIDFPKLAHAAVGGALDLAGMITQTIGLDDVERAFDDLRRGEVIRSVIVFD